MLNLGADRPLPQNCYCYHKLFLQLFCTSIHTHDQGHPQADTLDACTSKRNFWQNFFVVSISTASLLEVVFGSRLDSGSRQTTQVRPIFESLWAPLHMIANTNHSSTPNLHIAHLITSWNPTESFFQNHKAKIELLSFSSKHLLHLSYNKNGISGSVGVSGHAYTAI